MHKAEQQNAKLSKQEVAAAKALNKATHHHESVVTDLAGSDHDVKVRVILDFSSPAI